MPQAQLPFVNQQASGAEVLAGASPVAMNIIVDKAGAVRRRPGIKAHDDATSVIVDPAGLIGIHETLDGRIYAVGNGSVRHIYRVGGGVLRLGNALPLSDLAGSGRPVFAETEMLLVIAGGAAMQKVVLSDNSTGRLGGSPPEASHVLANASRLVANDTVIDRTKVRYSSLAQGTTTYAGHELWSIGGVGNTAGFFTAEARPDPIVAIGENTNELSIFGQGTLETYAPDPTFRYSRVSAQEVGCGAPYSVIKSGKLHYWLDDARRFVASNGRSFEPISQVIQQTLDDMVRVDDCFGYRVMIGPLDAVVWTFPTDGRTFCFQQDAGWSQWMGWDGNWKRFGVNALTAYNTIATLDGRIGQLSFNTQTDFGEPINAYVETGYLDNKTDAFKECNKVTLTLRRSLAPSNKAPFALLKYRDRPGPWEQTLRVDLGVSGETTTVVELCGLGTYRRRQWCFEFAGTEELRLISAMEDFKVTEN